jgi:hypothetical protein
VPHDNDEIGKLGKHDHRSHLYNDYPLRPSNLPDHSAHDEERQGILNGSQYTVEEVDIHFNWIATGSCVNTRTMQDHD